MTRANTSRMTVTNGPGSTLNRQFTNNSSSTHHQLTVQRSNFVDQFAFTEEEEEITCHSNFFNGDVRTPLWPNGGKGLPPLRNGRSHTVSYHHFVGSSNNDGRSRHRLEFRSAPNPASCSSSRFNRTQFTSPAVKVGPALRSDTYEACPFL